MSDAVTPFSLKDAPALIERLLPVQKLSAEAYKEQMASARQDADRPGQLLEGPQAADPRQGLHPRLPAAGHRRPGARPGDLREADGHGRRVLRRPLEAPPQAEGDPRHALHRPHRRLLYRRAGRRLADLRAGGLVEARIRQGEGRLARGPHRTGAPPAGSADAARECPTGSGWTQAQRPEEVMDTVHDHIWDAVNAHLGTSAHSFPELVEQLGIMRFGHRPRVADTFCGSGQIPSRRRGSAATSMPPTSTRWPACSPGGPSTSSAAPQRAARSWRRTSRNWCARCRRRSTSLASRPTARAGGPRSSSTASKSLPADRLDGAAAADADRQQGLSASSPNWCQIQ